MVSYQLVATTTIGIESCVKNELKNLGIEITKVENGYVEFQGDFDVLVKANIHLRCADRIYMNMKEFQATTFEELFQGVYSIEWEKIIDPLGAFPVSWVSSVNSKLFSKSDIQRIVKKAMVERLKKSHQVSNLPESGAQYAVKIQIEKNRVRVLLDSSGEALHKRGYRKEQLEAPLKESLAAALVYLSQWRGDKFALMDPCCGTGTIVIEAAMIAKNIAPGANRFFISENWVAIDETIWINERDKAYSQEGESKVKFYASDKDPNAVEIAKKNAERAGVLDCIEFSVLPFEELEKTMERRVIITNPPYGERMTESGDMKHFYEQLGKILKTRFSESSWHIITSFESFEGSFSSKADKNRKLYNGGLRCYLYQFLNRKK